MFNYFVMMVICTTVNSSPNGGEYLRSLSPNDLGKINPKIIEDSLLDTDQLIAKNGYPIQEHEVETEDGYLLTMYRIPNTKSTNHNRKPPVLLMHGLLGSSIDWIINGPKKALGYILADAGYDVWMGNARGNFYSRSHLILDPDRNDEFWNFSWEEIGKYDLPAMIDYILKSTKRNKIHYVGHSQGCTAFFVMLSERPELNVKILSMQGLAPAVFLSNAKSLMLRFAAPFAELLGSLLGAFEVNELLPNIDVSNFMEPQFCNDGSLYSQLCNNFLLVLCGFDPKQLNATMIPVYMSHTPAGSSTRQFVHFSQNYMSGKFRKLDLGIWSNLKKYGSFKPPEYNLNRVTAPVAIYYGESDKFVDPKDIKKLHEKIKTSIRLFKAAEPNFNHMDFIWAMTAPKLVYQPVLESMNKFNRKK